MLSMRRHSLASVTGHLAWMPDPICWIEDSPKFHPNEKALFKRSTHSLFYSNPFLVLVSFVLFFVVSFVKERQKSPLFTLNCTYVKPPLACNSTLMRRHSLASITGHLARMPDRICWTEDSPKFHPNEKALFEMHQ
jgi:hypothetical protein